MFRGGLGAPEILLILAVVVLLFGAKKLPELARGSGRALRIFKAETRGLMDDDDDKPAVTTAPARTDAPLSDRSLTDRSLTDRSLTDAPLTDRSSLEETPEESLRRLRGEQT